MALTCPPSGGETFEASRPRSKNLRNPHLLPGQSGNRAIGQLGNRAIGQSGNRAIGQPGNWALASSVSLTSLSLSSLYWSSSILYSASRWLRRISKTHQTTMKFQSSRESSNNIRPSNPWPSERLPRMKYTEQRRSS